MINIELYKIELFVLDRNTWNHLIECKQMSPGSYKNITNWLFVCKSHNRIWY